MDHGGGSSSWRGCRDKESSYGHWPPPHSARCLCLYLLLSLTLLLAIAAALLAVFVTRLKKPAFYLQSIQMDRSFSLRLPSTTATTSNRSANGTAAAPCAVASLVFAAQNLNGIGIQYGATVLDVAYANESVGAMDVPAFYQPPRSANVTVLMHAVLAPRNVTRLLVSELSAQRSYMEIRVVGRIDARTHIMNFPLPKVQVLTVDSTHTLFSTISKVFFNKKKPCYFTSEVLYLFSEIWSSFVFQFSLDCTFGTNYTDIVLREGIESVMTRKVFACSKMFYGIVQTRMLLSHD